MVHKIIASSMTVTVNNLICCVKSKYLRASHLQEKLCSEENLKNEYKFC